MQERDRIRRNIDKYGWHCLHILPTKDGQPCFSYTIGLTQKYQSPEIVIFGLARERAHAILAVCADLLAEGGEILIDHPDDRVLQGGYKVVFRMVERRNHSEYLGTAVRYYESEAFDSVVLFLPDSSGRFPWEQGYDYINVDEALEIVNPAS